MLTEVIEVDANDENTKICTVIDSVGCTITFTYAFLHEQTVKVSALKKKVDCPVPIDPLGKVNYKRWKSVVVIFLFWEIKKDEITK